MSKSVVMIGVGVANVNAATKLIDNGFKGKITINDGTDDSAPDSVTIVLDIPNAKPTANAGLDQNVETGSLVTLDGGESTDMDG